MSMRKARQTFKQKGGGKRSRSDGGNSIGLDKRSALQAFDYLIASCLLESLSLGLHYTVLFWFMSCFFDHLFGFFGFKLISTGIL